ncbi:hypothetical protein [Sphingobium lactosutens]|uniref:hypothetical protein n=1 Tax=Sphingobium lactosutens TaxID=522773 RepID=UPI0015BE925D|nr:hypothetical protein [Sphingobium lactosutens]
MDADLARILATGATNASRELNRLYDIFSRHLPEDKELLMAIAMAMGEIGLQVRQRAFDAHPELEAEFNQRVEKYDVLT